MSAVQSRWGPRYVLTSALFLVAWQGATLAGLGRPVGVALGLYGFVFTTLFGKAYSLVPSYFGRRLTVPWAPIGQFPLTVGGAALLAVGATGVVPGSAATLAGGLAWVLGVLVFLGAMAVTLRGNLLGSETATGEANREREPVDRFANRFVPVAGLYLLAGCGSLLFPLAAGGGPSPRTSHLLAAGTAALLVMAIGFRLFPRFLVAHPPRWLVRVVLPAGALGPGLVAFDLYGGLAFQLGAILESLAVVGFAAAFVVLYRRSDRRRVGFPAVLAAVAFGSLAVLLGLEIAIRGPVAGHVAAHWRLNLQGFLGLTIVGAAFQFYPPAVGEAPGASDRGALAAIGLLAGGLAGVAVGSMAGFAPLESAGNALSLIGAGWYAWILLAVFRRRGL